MKPVWPSSIKLRLTIFVGALLILTSSILIGTGYFFARDILIDQINERLTIVTADQQALLLAYIQQQQERVRLIASRTRLRQIQEWHANGLMPRRNFQAESKRILLDTQQSTKDFLDILITDIDGHVVAATSDVYLGQDFSTEPAFIEGQQAAYLDLPRSTPFSTSSNETDYYTFLSGPAIANDGQILGVIMVYLDLDGMEQILRETTRLGETGEILVGTEVADQVHYLLPPRHAPEMTTVPLTSAPSMTKAIQGQAGFIQTIDYRGVEVLAAHQPVGYQDWGIVAKIDLSEAYTPVERLRLVLMSIGGVILLIGLIAAFLLARGFIQPIIKLARTAAAFGKGDLSARVGLSPGSGELNQLAQAFDDMAHGLQVSYEALQKEIVERQAIADELSVLNETLEQRVAERTQALSKINTELETEIVERKRMEEALIRSNQELEQFAYGISHDLQEPLRKIQAFGDRLIATNEAALDEKGRDYLSRMQDAARRMQALINDLLEFSRVTTRRDPFTRVDLYQVVKAVLSDLQLRIEQSEACIEVSDLPDIEADPMQMYQLLQNLVSNALKYHRDDQVPHIKIYGELLMAEKKDYCRIMVKDNGIGFDEKYLDRIFIIFQRLHSRKTYQGTGIGLAICRKIVQRHNGSITAESVPDQGATFIITLPTKQAEQANEASKNGVP